MITDDLFAYVLAERAMVERAARILAERVREDAERALAETPSPKD